MMDERAMKSKKEFEEMLTKTKKEFEKQLKDTTKTIITRITSIEKKIQDDVIDNKNNINKLNEKVTRLFEKTNEQIK